MINNASASLYFHFRSSSRRRFIVVRFPLKKHIICRQRNAIAVLVGVFVAACATESFRLVVGCPASPKHRRLYSHLHVYFYQLLLHFTLPVVLIVSCNAYIICKIRQRRRRQFVVAVGAGGGDGESMRLRCSSRRELQPNRSTLTVSTAGSATAAAGSGPGEANSFTGRAPLAMAPAVLPAVSTAAAPRQRTTVMLVVVSSMYVIAFLPFVAISLVMSFVVAGVTDENRRRAQEIFILLYFNVRPPFELLSELNYATNFFVYVLAAEQFRAALCRQCGRHSGGGGNGLQQDSAIGLRVLNGRVSQQYATGGTNV